MSELPGPASAKEQRARNPLRPFVGGWHHGWRGKVWCGAGDWLRLEVGTVGGLWCFVGPVTFAASHYVKDGRRVFTASLYFPARRSRAR